LSLGVKTINTDRRNINREKTLETRYERKKIDG
jgi:hypothetical protein